VNQLIKANLESKDHDPEHSVQNYNILLALTESDNSALHLELMLGVDPQPIVESLPTGELSVHGQDALACLIRILLVLGQSSLLNNFFHFFSLLTVLVQKKLFFLHFSNRRLFPIAGHAFVYIYST
jgi:hypothetical protein